MTEIQKATMGYNPPIKQDLKGQGKEEDKLTNKGGDF